jgi:hypothetical protein
MRRMDTTSAQTARPSRTPRRRGMHLSRRTWVYRPGLPLAGSPQEAAAEQIKVRPAKHVAFQHLQAVNVPPRPGWLNELSTTPYYTDGELIFTVTHPFHPLSGQQFPLVAQRVAWGEPRIFFHDPTTGRLRSLPTARTNLAPVGA